MSWLDSFFSSKNYGTLQDTGDVLPAEPILNFVGFTVADDPTYSRTTVTNDGFVPTGTGIPHIVGGIQNAAASLIVNADVNASAAIAATKLAAGASNTVLCGGASNSFRTIVNADVNAAAAIAYSKLALATSILNTDISASAAIAYSKLNLATSIINADIAVGAAIAYSKLNLASSIVNADVAAAAAIAISKLAGAATSGMIIQDVSGVATYTAPFDPTINGLRLSLTTAVPITTTDVTGATTIYLTPYISGTLALYDGTNWYLRTTTEVSIALGTLSSGKNYDVFAYWTGSAIALEFSAAWTNDTTRADALARQNGVWVKSGTTTRRYIGTFRTTATTTTEDSLAKRFLWNFYNRVPRDMMVNEATNSWTYTTASYRQANGSAANQLAYVTGMADLRLEAEVRAIVYSSGLATLGYTGIGVDSTTVSSAKQWGVTNPNTNVSGLAISWYEGYPGLGYHILPWLELGSANVVFIGDFGGTDYQAGIHGLLNG